MRAHSTFAATLATLIAVGGCLGGTPVEDTGPPDLPDPATDAVALAGGDHLRWNATLEGDAGLRFRITPASSAVCAVTWSYKDDADGPGWDAFMVLEWGDDHSSVIYGNHRAQTELRAGGLVDASDFVTAARHDHRIDIRWRDWEVTEATWYTMGASGLARIDGAPPNVALDIVCDAAVTVDGWHAGREFIVFEAWTTDGGVAAGVAGAPIVWGAHAAVGDSFEATFEAAAVQFYMLPAYAAEGVFELTHPEGTESYRLESRLFEDRPFYSLVGGPGSYAVDVTEVGYFGDGYWSVLLGLDPAQGPADLEQLRTGHAHPCPGTC